MDLTTPLDKDEQKESSDTFVDDSKNVFVEQIVPQRIEIGQEPASLAPLHAVV